MSEVHEYTEISAVVVCHTENCRSKEIPYTIPLFKNPEPPLYRAFCAGCKTYITDITEV